MSYTLTYGQGGLADAAQYLSSKGRGEDSQLIHMMPSEIEALQQLAQQHGRSLTINPQTGLPEAGWLGDILKVGATAAAVYYGGPLLGGALAPTSSAALQAGLGMGLISGGITALETGSLKQGLGAGVTTGLIGGMMTPATANVATGTPAQIGADLASRANTGLDVAGSSAMQNSLIRDIPAAIPATAPVSPTVSPTGLWDKTTNWWKNDLTPNERLMYGIGGVGALGIIGDAMTPKQKEVAVDQGNIRPYTYASSTASPSPYPTGPMYDASGNPILNKGEQRYFNQGFTALPAYKAADGGLMAAGGLGNMYPQSQQYANDYASSISPPMGNEVVNSGYEQNTDAYTGEPVGYALGGMANLGDYSDGGRLLKGPGDGVSDSIPASIGDKQPARLADGEFVIPARIVSELGNGSTDAGAKRLYAMMDKIQSGRKKTVGKGKVAVDSKAEKYLPA